MTLDAHARAELQRELTRLADGDRQAFEPVFARLWPVVHALAARYLPAMDVDDAAQNANHDEDEPGARQQCRLRLR